MCPIRKKFAGGFVPPSPCEVQAPLRVERLPILPDRPARERHGLVPGRRLRALDGRVGRDAGRGPLHPPPIRGMGYAIGGNSSTGDAAITATVERYDGDGWEAVASLPEARESPAAERAASPRSDGCRAGMNTIPTE